MPSGPEGGAGPSRQDRLYDRTCSDSYLIQKPLDVAGESMCNNASSRRARCVSIPCRELSFHAQCLPDRPRHA